MMCPVVLPHPVDSSIFWSAGADGIARLWNRETVERVFSHTNKADVGPIEASEHRKRFGCLDGNFSSDGNTLVLTDDSGIELRSWTPISHREHRSRRGLPALIG